MCSLAAPCGGLMKDVTPRPVQREVAASSESLRILLCTGGGHTYYLRHCPTAVPTDPACLCGTDHHAVCPYGCFAWQGIRWVRQQDWLRYLAVVEPMFTRQEVRPRGAANPALLPVMRARPAVARRRRLQRLAEVATA